MSIADKITQLTTSRNNIRTALVEKGVPSASTHGFSNFSSDIYNIPAVVNAYSITTNLTHVTGAVNNPNCIMKNGTATLIFTEESTYTLPQNITVTGASSQWNASSKTLVLSNPTGNVSITIVANRYFQVSATGTNYATVNGTTSIITQIKEGSTMSFSIGVSSSSYKVPTTSPTVTGATGTYTRTGDTNATLVISNPTGDVSFTVTGEQAIVYPTKGQLITMNLGNATPAAGTNNQYRVLSINGSVAEVVAMYDMYTSQIFGADNTYSGSGLDTYLNSTFYNSLSSTAKAAIVDKTFTQDSWYWGTSGSPSYNGTYLNGSKQYDYQVSLGSNAYRTAITRHVYALSVQDVIDYLGVTTSMTSANTTLTAPNIWQMFCNTTTQPSLETYPWLRSASADNSNIAYLVNNYYGFVGYTRVDYDYSARPALTIDLSKISWS